MFLYPCCTYHCTISICAWYVNIFFMAFFPAHFFYYFQRMLHFCPFCNVVLKTIGKPLEAQYRWEQYVECVVCDMSGCFCKECKKSNIFTKQKQL